MARFSDWLPMALEHCMSAPDLLAQGHLVRSAREWCDITRQWQETSDVVLTVADQAAYDLPTPSFAEVLRILSADLDGREYLPQGGAYGRTQALNSRGRNTVTHTSGQTFSLTPTPTTSDLELRLQLVLRPVLTATTVPEAIEGEAEHIALGAAASLLGLTNQPWTDQAKAAQLRAKFLAEAKTRAARVSTLDRKTNQKTGIRWY